MTLHAVVDVVVIVVSRPFSVPRLRVGMRIEAAALRYRALYRLFLIPSIFAGTFHRRVCQSREAAAEFL